MAQDYLRDLLGEPCLECEDGVYMEVFPYIDEVVACSSCRHDIGRFMTKRQLLEHMCRDQESDENEISQS